MMTSRINLGDPELELIDPTPNIYHLFIQFDKLFFYARLASRAVVRWSKRMYSCAGICSYEGRGGLCDIALSEPLLKLRPRKDLVETLLHEMIHAYLFITNADRDRDGHGSLFQAHMHRINRAAGINISIYHDFHDEVKLYQTHIWRCNGPCQKWRPHFGIVRRPVNRAPGKADYWWECHRRNCGGTFVKIKEPENYVNKSTKPKTAPPKPTADITKYIINTPKTNNIPQHIPATPILKDSNAIPVKTKSNGGSALVITKKDPVFNPQSAQNTPPLLFNGRGQTLTNSRPRSNSIGVVETVRNVWAAKQLVKSPTGPVNESVRNIWANKKLPGLQSGKEDLNTAFNISNQPSKHKIDSHTNSPPAKVKKIDDYYKKVATTMLKDVYGQEFEITQINKDKKFVAVPSSKPEAVRKSLEKNLDAKAVGNKNITGTKLNSPIQPIPASLVNCPVCNTKVSNTEINRHLDECLNKEVIETLIDNQIETVPTQPSTSSQSNVKNLKEIVGTISVIPEFNMRSEVEDNIRNELIVAKVDLVQEELNTAIRVLEQDISAEDLDLEQLNNNFIEENVKIEGTKKNTEDLNPDDVNKVKDIGKKVNNHKNVQGDGNLGPPIKGKSKNVDIIHPPSFSDKNANENETSKIKIEPGTSKDVKHQVGQKCACCGKILVKSIEEHLDECLAFFDNNDTMPLEGASTSFANETIVIDDDDDDIFDDSQIYNATGTKSPCPCCLEMIEDTEMNNHLDQCLAT